MRQNTDIQQLIIDGIQERKGRGITIVDMSHIESAATSREEIGHFPYRPRLVLKGVGEIPAAKGLPSAASACIIDKDPGQVPQGAPDSKGQPPCLKGAAK